MTSKFIFWELNCDFRKIKFWWSLLDSQREKYNQFINRKLSLKFLIHKFSSLFGAYDKQIVTRIKLINKQWMSINEQSENWSGSASAIFMDT